MLLDLETKVQDGGEGVGELHDADGGDEGGDVGELRNRRGNDEGCGVVEGNEEDPQGLALLGSEVGAAEHVLNDVLVDDLDTNVAIENSCNKRRDQVEGVGRGLPSVGTDALVGRIVGELTLSRVDYQAEDQVADIDEHLSHKLSLDEVQGSLHLSHELAVKHSTTVSIHDLHSRTKLAVEGGAAGDPDGVLDGSWWVRWLDGEVWSAVAGNSHGEDDDQKIEPDGEVGEISELLQGSDLTNDHGGKRPDETADGEAELELGHLRQSLAVTNDNDADVEQELDALEQIHAVASPGTVDSETEVAEGLHGVSVGIELQEHSPDLPAGKEGHDTHAGVDEDTADITKLGDGVGSVTWTEDISGDQVDTARVSC